MVEFAVAFPLQLFIAFGIIQLILLYVSNMMVNYAAYQATRAAIVTSGDVNGDGDLDHDDVIENAHIAASVVLAPLAGHALDPEDRDETKRLRIPGWGNLRGSEVAYAKTLVHELDNDDPESDITLVVEFDQQLVFPLVDRIFAVFLKDADEEEERMVFGMEDAAFESQAYANREPVYGTDRGRVRKIGGYYHVVLTRRFTAYRKKAANFVIQNKLETGVWP